MKDEQKTQMPKDTTSDVIETAFHGTNMSCLYSIMSRRMLDIGPSAKKSTRHEKQYQFGVYCHKHGTKKKTANYMKYWNYKGAFIVAPLLQLNVRNYIACEDQWCVDPYEAQIEKLWINIVPAKPIGRNKYFILDTPWTWAGERSTSSAAS